MMHANKKLIVIGVALILAIAIGGCATNREITPKVSQSTRNDVFSESSTAEVETGKATVGFVFSVKSISSRLFEIYYKHSNPPFRVYLNIDGQTTILDAEPLLENRSPIKPDAPESGTGWRYDFNKRIVLAPGKHKLTIAIPVDDVIVERDIELHAGANTIAMTPVYKKRSSRPYRYLHFSAGVKTIEVLIN